MLLILAGCIPALVVRFVIVRKPLRFAWAFLTAVALLIGFLAVIQDMSPSAPQLAGAAGAISVGLLMIPSSAPSSKTP